MADYLDATCFLQVDCEFWNYGGVEHPRNAKVVRLTRTRPRRPEPGTVLVKVTLRVPETVFLPLRPEAIVVVPESMTTATPLIVEAADPGG